MQMTVVEAVESALPGAFDYGDGLVTFALYAPGKQSVELIVAPHGQSVEIHQMDDRGGGFWVTPMNLPKGKCEYRFRLDHETVIADPYAQEIRRVRDDDVPWAVVDAGRGIYMWRNEDWRRPNFRDLIVYELHVGDFSPEGNFAGVRKRLDYLRDLGVNAIEFMPLYESSPDDYWGYKPTYFMAVRSSYGSLMDMIELVDECHAREIGVVMDMVLAHTGDDHPFNAMYPYKQSPWYGKGLGEPNQFGLPMLDFSKDATNSFVRDVQAYWMHVAHVDGFRYDYLAGIGAADGQKGLPYLMRTAREIRPESYLIGECIPEDPELVNNSGLGGVWHTRSRLAMSALLAETQFQPYDWNDFDKCIHAFDPATQDYDQASFMVNYIECHDDERIIKLLLERGFDYQTALRKSALAATLLMTMPGEPMLYHGQEMGEDSEKILGPNKLRWDRLDSPEGAGLADHYKRMCRLRNSKTSLRERNIRVALVDAQAKCAVIHRWWGQADQVVIAVNFSNRPRRLSAPVSQRGRWHELDTGEITEIKDAVETTIEAYSARIFIIGVS